MGRLRIFVVMWIICLANVMQYAEGFSRLNNGFMKLESVDPTKKCNVYEGSWVVNDESNLALYDSSTCPYIRKEFNCRKYGRKNEAYLRYRWQPNGCDLSRFNGQDLMRRLKGKKIMFIGDSISMNQMESLICMLHAHVPKGIITEQTNASISTFTFEDYDLSLVLFHSSYLVDIETEEIGRVLKLDSLKAGDAWKHMDVLIFNSWLWWYRNGAKQPWDYIQDGEKIAKDMDRMVAFQKALTTWGKWVDSDIISAQTRVFFQGISPSHYSGEEWGEKGVTNCSNETIPLEGSIYPGGFPEAAKVVKNVLSNMKRQVHLLDITTLSQLRKDAHPSTNNGFHSMDCTHWCLAGLPDTWNQLLYVSLISS